MSIEKLNLLGIFNQDQFSKGDLKFWWSKQSNQIKLSDISKQVKNESLIEINNIYDELKEYDLQTLKNYFPKIKNKKSQNKIIKENKLSESNEINSPIPKQMRKVENESDVREFHNYDNMAKEIEKTIRIRNKNGWQLKSTDAVRCGETMAIYFLYWERDGVQLIENASDLKYFSDWENMAKEIEKTIRIRNKNGWQLLSTNACGEQGFFSGSGTLYFLYWRRSR